MSRDPLTLDVVPAARALIGWTVSHAGCAGVIVETEAYHEHEPACHAHVGRTARTHILFGAPGAAYVYRSYGIHALLNVVVEPEGTGAAVLIRALEPVLGVELMRRRRAREADIDLCSGPGKLTQALGIGLELNGTDLRTGPIRLEPPPAGRRGPALVSAPRVGITKAVDLPWRYCARGSRHISRPRPPGLGATRPRTRARTGTVSGEGTAGRPRARRTSPRPEPGDLLSVRSSVKGKKLVATASGSVS